MKIIINQRNTHFWTAGWAWIILANLPDKPIWFSITSIICATYLFILHFKYSKK